MELIERESDISLILVDYAMPGMSGAEVARQAIAKRPELPVVFVTGYADLSALQGVDESRIIGKPFLDGELAEKVRAAFGRRE